MRHAGEFEVTWSRRDWMALVDVVGVDRVRYDDLGAFVEVMTRHGLITVRGCEGEPQRCARRSRP